MELRKDPITRSWVITGDDVAESISATRSVPVLWRFCRVRAGHLQPCPVSTAALGRRVRSFIPTRSTTSKASPDAGAMVYTTACGRWEPTKCSSKILVMTATCGMRPMARSNSSCVLAAQRIQDLKRDSRFKYVSVFKNHGEGAGQEFDHPTSQLTATTLCPAVCSTNFAPGATIFRARSVASSATSFRKKSGSRYASSKCAETLSRSVPTRHAFRTKPGFCLAATNPLSKVRLRRVRETCATWLRFCARPCSEF